MFIEDLMQNHVMRRQRRRSAASSFHGTMFPIVVFVIALLTIDFHQPMYGVASALTTAQRRAIVLSKIKRGMHLSQEAKHNVTAAEEACTLWESVLSRPSVASGEIITNDVLSLSKTLYASCLVRVGRDLEAVVIYDSCLDISDNHDESTNWILAKARCLQRLLKYADAAKEFEKAVNIANGTDKSDAAKGASTCILRSSGNVVLAQKILAKTTDSDSRLLSCCLEYLETGNKGKAVEKLQEIISKIHFKSNDGSSSLNSSANSFLLYRWILFVLRQEDSSKNHLKSEVSTIASTDSEIESGAVGTRDLFMELIRINTSPLDDPHLLQLDDKIELHNLLSSTTKRGAFSSSEYWPKTMVLHSESSKVDELTCNDSELWISKSRAGYGSHGNQILTLEDANKQLNKDSIQTEPYLLQRMVDPLMLLDGYKFSLRIYVVFFSSKEAYISSKGLVKLASMPLSSDEQKGSITDTKMHMTNSGRETVMRQEDLEYLWKEFNVAAEKEDLWNAICKVASDTLLVRYPERQEFLDGNEQKQEWKDRREGFGIPKILGLDFVIQDSVNRKRPWLVEVNRFPGLEPRDEDDRKIKYKIVRDAWKLATERRMKTDEDDVLDFDVSIFDSLGNDTEEESSLEQLLVV